MLGKGDRYVIPFLLFRGAIAHHGGNQQCVVNVNQDRYLLCDTNTYVHTDTGMDTGSGSDSGTGTGTGTGRLGRERGIEEGLQLPRDLRARFLRPLGTQQ